MVNILEPPARAALYLALMLVVGVPIGALGVVLPTLRWLGLSTAGASATLLRWTQWAVILMLIGALALFAAQVAPLELELADLEAWSEFIRLSLLGQMLIVRLGLGLLALAALLLVGRLIGATQAKSGFVIMMTACALSGLAAHATLAGTSHSAAMDVGLAPVLADFAHLLAGALWGGGVITLLVTSQHLRQTADSTTALAAIRLLSQRFSPFGLLGIALALGTGLALSSVHVPDAESLSGSLYGQLVLLKLGLVIVIVTIGAVLRRAIYQGSATSQKIQRLLIAEALIACGIFFSAALLTSTAPPHEMIVHQMSDGSVHVMHKADSDFQRLLSVVALAVFAAGAFAVVLEWRNRLKGSEI
jgi:putative copper export protein